MCVAVADEIETLRCNPDVAGLVAGDGLEIGIASLRQRNQAHNSFIEPHQTRLRADPYLPLVVLEDAKYGIAGQKSRAADARKLSIPNCPKAMPNGSDP